MENPETAWLIHRERTADSRVCRPCPVPCPLTLQSSPMASGGLLPLLTHSQSLPFLYPATQEWFQKTLFNHSKTEVQLLCKLQVTTHKHLCVYLYVYCITTITTDQNPPPPPTHTHPSKWTNKTHHHYRDTGLYVSGEKHFLHFSWEPSGMFWVTVRIPQSELWGEGWPWCWSLWPLPCEDANARKKRQLTWKLGQGI